MHLSLAFFLYLLPLLSAAPASNASTSESADGGNSVSAALSTPNRDVSTAGVSVTPPEQSGSKQATSKSTTPSSIHKPTVGTTKHHIVVTTPVPHTGGQITARPTQPFVPGPAPSHFHPPPPPPPHHQSEATLVFEILGALAGVVFFLSVMRCIYSYHRTPSRDRITAILHRHQLQREMEELERNPPDRRGSLVEPPPPYVPPPPSYPVDESTPLSRESVAYGEDPRTPPSAPRPNG